VSNSVSVSVSNSVSVSVSIVYSGVNSSAVSVSGSGATSTDVSLSISVDDDMVDADGNNIHWYFADYGSPEFKTDNIVVMNGEDDITDEVTIDFGDQTPETVYDGENFDYVVEFTVTYGDQTATGSINAKIGQRGDANCDHSLNARDAAAIARDLAQLFRTGTTTLTAEDGFALFLANVNEDVVAEGKETDYYGSRNINARDAALIARFLSQKFSDPDLQLVDLVVD
jgi:hypothetical protein